MKILVTGGAGFIGSHIVDALRLRGYAVEATDQPLDITSRAFRDMVRHTRPDAICHQAAQASLRRSIDDPAEDARVNIIGTINVIEAARAAGAHVVFASTSAVYDPAGGTFAEDSPLKPNLPYGISKASAELYLRNSGISHTVLRYGNVYGPRQQPVGENQLIPHALAHIFDRAPFAINGDGEQSRDFVYVADIARANVLALEGKVRGTFNLGWGTGVTINGVCRLLRGVAEWEGTFRHGPGKPGEARHVALTSRRAYERLGWAPTVPMLDGLRATVEAWRDAR
jgi:UDP-glucose 4-epimerase